MTADDLYALRSNIIELGAWISIWRDDVAGNLKPTTSSLEKAATVCDRAMSDLDALLGTRQPKKEDA